MSGGSIFGALIPNGRVEQAVLATLETWLPTYLSEVERQQSLTVPTLQRPRSFQSSYDFQNWPDQQIPALVVVCHGTTGESERHGDGSYSLAFDVRVGVLVEDVTEADARRVSELHQAAFDGVLVQRGSLGGVASDTILTGRLTELPDVNNRTLAYAESQFHVYVDGIATSQGGPPTPDAPLPDPTVAWPPWTRVQSTQVTVTGVEPSQPLP